MVVETSLQERQAPPGCRRGATAAAAAAPAAAPSPGADDLVARLTAVCRALKGNQHGGHGERMRSGRSRSGPGRQGAAATGTSAAETAAAAGVLCRELAAQPGVSLRHVGSAFKALQTFSDDARLDPGAVDELACLAVQLLGGQPGQAADDVCAFLQAAANLDAVRGGSALAIADTALLSSACSASPPLLLQLPAGSFAAAVWACGKLASRGRGSKTLSSDATTALADALVAAASRQDLVCSMSLKQVSNTLHGAQKLVQLLPAGAASAFASAVSDGLPPAFLSACGGRTAVQLRQGVCDPHATSTILATLSRLGHADEELLAAVASAAAGSALVNWKPRDVSSLVASLVRLRRYDARMLAAASRHAAASAAQHYSPADVSELLGSFARLGHQPPRDCLDALCTGATQRLRQTTMRQLVTIFWSLAKLGHVDDGLVAAATALLADQKAAAKAAKRAATAAAAASDGSGGSSSSDLAAAGSSGDVQTEGDSSVSSASGSSSSSSPTAPAASADSGGGSSGGAAAILRIQELSADAGLLAKLCWSLVKLQRDTGRLLRLLQPLVRHHLSGSSSCVCSNQEAVMMLWSLAAAGQSCPPVLKAGARLLQQRAGTLDGQQVATALWAAAKLASLSEGDVAGFEALQLFR